MALLSIVVPVCNEEENIKLLYEEIVKYTVAEMELLWVDDGSTDHTLLEINSLCQADARVKCISLSKNFGHQNAIMAGLKYASGDIIVIMDGDMQHPASLIMPMTDKIKEGFDIVYTKRLKTTDIPFIKKIISRLYYKIINLISDVKIEENSADFKAFNKKVLVNILSFDERELFLRGIFTWAGFKSATLPYTAPARLHGKTKYSFRRMFDLGFKGATSFWVKPLRIALWAGFIICFFSFILAVWSVVAHFQGHTIRGWTSLIITIIFFGGVQLFFLGLLGEYIGSIFIEVKKRPLYIVDKTINVKNTNVKM
jgi:glycosyltransferase involved in cell wall biosynthesis